MEVLQFNYSRSIIQANKPHTSRTHKCSVHMTEELFERIEGLCTKANKSRDQLMYELLEFGSMICSVRIDPTIEN